MPRSHVPFAKWKQSSPGFTAQSMPARSMPDVCATLAAAGGDDDDGDDVQASAASVSAISLVRATALAQVFDMVSYWLS